MKLIINADDFGLTNGVTYGIYDAIKHGIATSTTMMVNTAGSELASWLAKNDTRLNIGLHLNLSLGKPLTACRSLVDEKGIFIRPKMLINDEQYDEEEVYREFEAQYFRFVSLAGREPTHIDSHLYLHQIFPKAGRQAKRLSEKICVPLRQYNTKHYKSVYFEGGFKRENGENTEAMKEKFKKLVAGNSEKEYVELMTHPGYLDAEILEISSYSCSRIMEAAVLKDPEIKEFVSKNGIELISFADIEREKNG